jgi:TfoX/Sxy family transcriptional regulator of competence genes
MILGKCRCPAHHEGTVAYSERLLERIRAVLAGRTDVVEKRMFGGVAFMVSGRMACGPHGNRLIVRIGNEAAKKYVGQPNVRPMDFTGKVLRSFATIEPDGIKTAAQLRKWVLMAARFAVQDSDPGKQSNVHSLKANARRTRRRRT